MSIILVQAQVVVALSSQEVENIGRGAIPNPTLSEPEKSRKIRIMRERSLMLMKRLGSTPTMLKRMLAGVLPAMN
ncbi:hypothetical protein [Fischerella thermalis]|uniref:hypothetical protein n=1 Tax=Fischerella thermalis TaxID=372787 RepID=UPI0021557916|nr:hypothetical protein [Fischerella thermalis]